jgi:hypothetical protein
MTFSIKQFIENMLAYFTKYPGNAHAFVISNRPPEAIADFWNSWWRGSCRQPVPRWRLRSRQLPAFACVSIDAEPDRRPSCDIRHIYCDVRHVIKTVRRGMRREVMSRRESEIRCSKISVSRIALGISLSVLMPASTAFACGGVFDVACNLSHGGLSPNNIQKQVEKAGQDAANVINELQASTLSGPALEQAIIASHNTAINGASPIPAEVRQQLTGYASEDSMNRVRYKIGDSGFANLAHLLEQGGLASAVTLIDVVVFRGPSEAADPSIWAHELTHVDQYRDWGVRSFAVQYARNWHSVEDPAYAKGDGYRAWAANRGTGMAGPVVQPFPVPQVRPFPVPQVNVGAFCYTEGGRFGPGPLQPVGSPCWANTQWGQLNGQIGM